MTKQKKTARITGGTKFTKKKQRTVAAATTKLAQLEVLLRRPQGATIDQMSTSIGWRTHSVRGAMSGMLKKKQGLTITSDKAVNGQRIYRIAA